MRTCSTCQIEKDLSSFSKKGTGFQYTCKICHSLYRKEHYDRNRSKYIERASKNRQKYREEFYDWLSKKQCMDCGNSDIRVLQFDHLGDKEFVISSKIGRCTLSSIMKEIEKCDIVCANCHGIRTCERGGWYKTKIFLNFGVFD